MINEMNESDVVRGQEHACGQVDLEGGENAAILLGVDYEKAFNRLQSAFSSCACLVRQKAVRAFLENRQLMISIDGERAAIL